ncbi:FG-GAP-like repeat-containing protein [Phytohabitans flavus]|uniref:FG-GAP-like repeat-containing protein n=1 Tax=Phytohabitans flavus TaxID=1076124 RepID=UPI00363E5611
MRIRALGSGAQCQRGHPSWLIEDIANITDSALATYRPNVVLLHIGTNDMNRDVDPSGAIDRLTSLIDQIFRGAPGVTLLVSTLVPSSNATTQARINAYNTALLSRVDQLRASGKHVLPVRMSAVTTADLADYLHPSDAGYRKMAAAFLRGVLAVASAGWITPPLIGGGPPRGWTSAGVIANGPFTAGGYPGSLSMFTDKVRFGDVNGDGRADYLVSHSDGSVRVWVNNGVGPDGAIAWDAHGGNGTPYAPALQWQVADLNADGRADMARINPDGSVAAYLNGGTNAQGHYIWNSQGQIASGVGESGSQIQLADIDGDGRPDYLNVRPDGSVQAWLAGPINIGGWPWIPVGTVANGVDAPGSRIRFADLNADGRADYLDVAPDGSVRAWVNAGPQAHDDSYAWIPQGRIANGVGSASSRIHLTDLNGDRRADYVDVDAVTGTAQAWRNGGAQAQTGSYFWDPMGTITTGGSGRIEYADIDGDHDPDYLSINADGSVGGWLNGGAQPGDDSFVWQLQGAIANGVGEPGSQIRFADIDGDGKADYLNVNPDGTVDAWINISVGPGQWRWYSQGRIANGVGAPGHQIRFADLNGDRRADYINVNPGSSVHAWLNGGPQIGDDSYVWHTQGKIANGVNVPGPQVRFADLDGDGRADYINLNPDGSAQAWLNGGAQPGDDSYIWNPVGTAASGVGEHATRIRFADVNGDGRADYLAVYPVTGSTQAWINTP